MSDSARSENRPSRRRDMPGGLWTRCPGCTKMIYKNLVVERGNVCPECDYHFQISSDERIRNLCDPDTFVEFLADLSPADPLGFVARRSYEERGRETRHGGCWCCDRQVPRGTPRLKPPSRDAPRLRSPHSDLWARRAAIGRTRWMAVLLRRMPLLGV